MKCTLFLIANVFLCLTVVRGQDFFAGYEHLFTAPRQYTACKTTGHIIIDGKLNEASWNAVAWSDEFTDIEGNTQPAPALKTRFKILWDDDYVYIAAELVEPHIWATLRQHDAIIFHDNDFEIFIDPDGDTQNYFEIEVNPYNTIFDLFLPKPYRSGGFALINWDVQNLKSAVLIKGTINNPSDTDEKWQVEMAIPFRSISLGNVVQLPKEHTAWRINFSRIEWDTEIKNGASVKRTDSFTHHPLPEHNWVWSPQGVIDMHLPERWGYVFFSTEKAGSLQADMPLPISEELKKYLWLVFYKQQTFRQQQQHYATTLSQINIPSLITVAGLNCSIVLDATGSQFIAVLQAVNSNEKWQIDQDGKIIKL